MLRHHDYSRRGQRSGVRRYRARSARNCALDVRSRDIDNSTTCGGLKSKKKEEKDQWTSHMCMTMMYILNVYIVGSKISSAD